MKNRTFFALLYSMFLAIRSLWLSQMQQTTGSSKRETCIAFVRFF